MKVNCQDCTLCSNCTECESEWRHGYKSAILDLMVHLGVRDDLFEIALKRIEEWSEDYRDISNIVACSRLNIWQLLDDTHNTPDLSDLFDVLLRGR